MCDSEFAVNNAGLAAEKQEQAGKQHRASCRAKSTNC